MIAIGSGSNWAVVQFPEIHTKSAYPIFFITYTTGSLKPEFDGSIILQSETLAHSGNTRISTRLYYGQLDVDFFNILYDMEIW